MKHDISWSNAEVGVLARATGRAPALQGSRPWVAEIRPEGAELYERFDGHASRHDPSGRRRMISCGAALADLDLAAHVLGWATRVSLFPEPERPDLVARVVATGRAEATDDEVALYSAIFRRRSGRRSFGPGPVTEREIEAVVNAGTTPATRITPARTGHSARECLLIVLTPDDTRRDQVLAGQALQRMWLTAVSAGLAAGALTEPPRSGLTGEVAGCPQVILRVGHPGIDEGPSAPAARTGGPHLRRSGRAAWRP
ncbi:hypothetical protein [Amycolatopsis acididurans]|uniref:hypothetical protein n=1 Tax=Amycolatopsis acididurans TaxID=2724524 RepID=UPI001B327C76|nr:hypothetical protein [Amycolatopsis acididurans]